MRWETHEELYSACSDFAADAARWHNTATALVVVVGALLGALAWAVAHG